MLLAVAVKFLLCNYLMIAVNIWEHLAGSQIAVGTLYKLCVELSNLLVVVNSASDSIVYFRWRQKRPPAVSCSNALKTLFTPDEANLLKNEFMCHVSLYSYFMNKSIARFKRHRQYMHEIFHFDHYNFFLPGCFISINFSILII